AGAGVGLRPASVLKRLNSNCHHAPAAFTNRPCDGPDRGAQLGTMRGDMECGGKRSATPLWIRDRPAKALSPLRSASALQILRLVTFSPWCVCEVAPLRLAGRNDLKFVAKNGSLSARSRVDEGRTPWEEVSAGAGVSSARPGRRA